MAKVLRVVVSGVLALATTMPEILVNLSSVADDTDGSSTSMQVGSWFCAFWPKLPICQR